MEASCTFHSAGQLGIYLDLCALDDMRGRAWKVGTKISAASLSCPPDHFYRKPKLAFREQLGTAIRQAKAFIANSKDQLLNIPMEAMTSVLPKLPEMYPMVSPIKTEIRLNFVARDIFAAKLQDFLVLPPCLWQNGCGSRQVGSCGPR